MPETAKRTARVPILGEDGRISDDYVPAAIGENVTKAESAATRAETAATGAEGSASAASKSAAQASGSASAASASATKAQESATAAGGAVTQAQSAQNAAEAAKTAAETAQSAAAGSAQDAQQSATAAAQSAASVADKFITSAQATTLEPGSEATASVADQVLTLGIPRGDKGDKGDTGEKGDPGDVSAVQTAEGSDLSVSTDAGTVTIDDSALRERIAELEQQAANVVTGTSTGLVAHAEDAYDQKPREVRIKGKTWVNRWPVLSGTNNGITVATDGTGLVTVTGTATADADVTADVSGWATGKSYTTMVSATPAGCSAYFEVQKPSGNTPIDATTAGATLNVASDATNCVAGIHVTSGTTVNASFRVMLVDGTEVPDCFTPCASIASVETGKLVTSGKNLLNEDTPTADGVVGPRIPPGDYALSGMLPSGASLKLLDGGADGDTVTNASSLPHSFTAGHPFTPYYAGVGGYATGLMLELGSTATAYEPPTVTQTPLPEVELRSLPNGTCDELVIRADGTCEVERSIGVETFDGSETWSKRLDSDIPEFSYMHSTPRKGITRRLKPGTMLSDMLPTESFSSGNSYLNVYSNMTLEEFQAYMSGKAFTVCYPSNASTEPQSPVTLPTLPAPTFNQYHDADVPSDTSTQYVRDINIVLSELQAQISATTVREATNG